MERMFRTTRLGGLPNGRRFRNNSVYNDSVNAKAQDMFFQVFW
jgi:hypothetical protein